MRGCRATHTRQGDVTGATRTPAAARRDRKAIPTAAMCLTCHGSDLASDVEGKLDELYPKDAARGFSVGDLRGAFTLNKAL